jgi:hypothetical protein
VDERAPSYLDDTFPPILIADQNRTVHAFANQWVGDENRQMAIVYRQWSVEKGWTAPNDILLSPSGNTYTIGAFLDQAGMLHVVFLGGDIRVGNLYYSRALAVDAGQAPAWSTPQLIGTGLSTPPSGALVGDDEGNLVIIYSGNLYGYGIYSIRSSDAGDSWLEPESVYSTYDPELIPFSVNATIGHTGQVHAVWNVVTPTGLDVSVYYSRLDVDRQVWSEPILLEERIEKEGYFGPSFPRIVDNGEHLVVMYYSGNPSTDGPVAAGRPVQRVRLSSDNGTTWTEPTTPFTRHLGKSGEYSLVVDSNQIVHVVFMQRIEITDRNGYTVIDGPWHSELSGTQWSEPVQISTQLAPHDMRAIVSQGNVLLVTWREDPGLGQHGVWSSYTLLDAPELPVAPLPAAPFAAIAIPTPTPMPTRDAVPAVPVATPSPQPVAYPANTSPSSSREGPAGLLVVAATPIMLLLAVVIFVNQWTYRGRR